MADIQITNVFTADPNSGLSPKNWFYTDDAFGIVVEVSFSDEAREDNSNFEVTVQLVNPLEDPHGAAWFDPTTHAPMPTIDFTSATDAAASKIQYFFGWTSYKELMQPIGAGLVPGVFAVRASIRSTVTRDSYAHEAFDLSAPFAGKYHFRGPRPLTPGSSSSGGGGGGSSGGPRGSSPRARVVPKDRT